MAFLQVPEAAYQQQHKPIQSPGQWLIVSHFLFGEGLGNDANNDGAFIPFEIIMWKIKLYFWSRP
jgi:hypothetical protein